MSCETDHQLGVAMGESCFADVEEDRTKEMKCKLGWLGDGRIRSHSRSHLASDHLQPQECFVNSLKPPLLQRITFIDQPADHIYHIEPSIPPT